MVILLAMTLIALYFVLRSKNNQYPTEPVSQLSLNSTNEAIALNTTKVEASQGNLYTVSTTTMLSKVEDFVQNISPKFVQVANDEGLYYEWQNGKDSIIYELEQDTIIFNIEKGIAWNEANITGYSFTQFVNTYFGKDWVYSIPVGEKQISGETIYYVKRVLEGINVETNFIQQSTDYLATKNGKIVYGKILLVDFVESKEKVPLISSEDLDRYINLKGYPKEVYPEYESLQKTVLSRIDYKTEDFQSIIDTLSNCKSISASIIYLYKSMDQGNLTPVYKLDLQCEVTYKNTQYTIPAIGYVNAIDPKYVTTP